jgi:hypothetical protein
MIEAQVNYMSFMIEEVLKARYTGQTLALTPKKDLTVAYNKNMQEGESSSFPHMRKQSLTDRNHSTRQDFICRSSVQQLVEEG